MDTLQGNTEDKQTPPRPSRLALAGAFLKIGAQAFGGIAGAMAITTREIVERRQWVTEEELAEALAYTTLLPGPTALQLGAFLGWKLGGLAGGVLVSLAVMLPAFLLMLALAIGYHSIGSLAGVSAAIRGMTAVLVSVLLVSLWTLGKKNIAGVSGAVIAVVALVASARYNVHPALLVVAGGLFGVLREAVKPQ